MFGRGKRKDDQSKGGDLDGFDELTGTSFKNFDANKTREAIFKALELRIGKENTDLVKDDFLGHITDDPIHGVEKAYVCLLGKIVEMVDLATDFQDQEHSKSTPSSSQSVSPFAMYRKDG